MTLNELKNDVARLGFESYIEDNAGFIASVNRALALIYIDRPVSRDAVISSSGPRATLIREFIEHRSGESITLSFTGRAISFRASGTGICLIKDDTGEKEVAINSERQLVKRLIHGNASITFLGDYYFSVSNLAVFDDLINGNT